MLYFSIESTNFLVKKLTTQNFWRSSYLDISFYFGAFFFYRKYQFFGEKIDNSKFLEELIPWHFILFWCFFFLSKVPIFWWKNWQLKIFGGAHTLTFHFILVLFFSIESTNFLVKKLTTQNFWRSSYLDISFHFSSKLCNCFW